MWKLPWTRRREPTLFVYALIHQRLPPAGRTAWYERPLEEFLEGEGLGEVTGGGTLTDEDGEILSCGLDVELTDASDESLARLAGVLADLGAPRGSQLEYTRDRGPLTIPFGDSEGLAIYLNGVDLPDEVYEHQDPDQLRDQLQESLGGGVVYAGHWDGYRDTALYFYGASFETMSGAIRPVLESHPLAAKCRVVQIA